MLKEEGTKTDLILPLFRALGWDTEDSNEVSKEEKISKNRVDYGFRINGIPKFFPRGEGARREPGRLPYGGWQEGHVRSEGDRICLV